MNFFKGLIKCMKCGKNYNFKNDHGQYIYICSGYKNYGSTYCPRNVVEEEDILHLIKMHFSMALIDENTIKQYIDRIEVDGESISVFYKDGTKSELNNTHLSI